MLENLGSIGSFFFLEVHQSHHDISCSSHLLEPSLLRKLNPRLASFVGSELPQCATTRFDGQAGNAVGTVMLVGSTV